MSPDSQSKRHARHETNDGQDTNAAAAPAKRAAQDTDTVEVLPATKRSAVKKVSVKDLRDLTRHDDSRMSNLRHYVANNEAETSDDSSEDSPADEVKNGDNDNKLTGPIFQSWCN